LREFARVESSPSSWLRCCAPAERQVSVVELTIEVAVINDRSLRALSFTSRAVNDSDRLTTAARFPWKR